MKITKLFINGNWISGKNTFTSVEPATGKPYGLVYQGEINDINEAIKAAKNALPHWRETPIKDRTKFFKNFYELLLEEYGKNDESISLKKLITSEVGKCSAEADIEVIESSDIVSYYIKNSAKYLKDKVISINQKQRQAKKSILHFEPIGVIGMIKPWNYPLEIPLWSLLPALISGNTVVFKPSEYSSFIGIAIGKLFEEARLPPGVLNIITGDEQTGKLIVNHKNIDMISFTGSVKSGREIAKKCSERLIKYVLELGGNDAAIIEPDADIELVKNGLTWGAFCNSGQVCVRPKRAFIHTKIYHKLRKQLVDNANSLRIGIDYGPIINNKQLVQIEEQLNDALLKGAKILAGGKRVPNKGGFYFLPTIIENINFNMKIMNEECFGPILPIIPVKNTEEAIKLANNSLFGLGASVWTSDLVKGEKISKSLETGMVWINDVNIAYPEAPWGSRKFSGSGIELSEWGLYEFVHKKHISIELSKNKNREWWYPYSEKK